MIKILIADDMQILRDCLRLTIENEEEFEVVGCAGNGKEAVDMCKIYYPDIILMDLNMPVYSGHDAIKEIKNFNKSVKILVLTVESDEENINAAFKNGADGYLLKNIGFRDLYSMIKNTYEGKLYSHENAFSIGHGGMSSNDLESYFKKINNISIMFTPREKEVLELVVEGMTNEEIAKKLEISVGRSRNIVTELINKCMVKNRTQLAVLSIKASIIKDF